MFTFEDMFMLKPAGPGVRTCYFVFSSHRTTRPYTPFREDAHVLVGAQSHWMMFRDPKNEETKPEVQGKLELFIYFQKRMCT